MKTKIKSDEAGAVLFDIQIPKEDIEKAFDEVYSEMQKAANIPGFRIGKAPIAMVKSRYVKEAREEVLKRLIPKAYGMAVEEHKVDPIGFPEVSDVNLEEGKPLSFQARVETRPKFKLKNYRGIKVEKKKAALKEDDIDKTLENLRELNAKYVAVEDRPLQFGDYAVCDLECFVDGKPIHKKRENLWVLIDKEAIIPGLHENMAGMRKSEEKDIDCTLPDKYPEREVAGKKARYHVKLSEIKARVLPDKDDEFAKDLGRDNLEALRKEVGQELEERMRLNAQADMTNQLLKKLIDDNIFQIPKGPLVRQIKYMVEDAKERLKEKGFKKEDLDKKDDEFKEKFKEDAARQVRLFFILDEIALKENIDVSGEDIAKAHKEIAARTGKTEDDVKKYYEKEGLTGDLEEKLRERKTIAFLLKESEVV